MVTIPKDLLLPHQTFTDTKAAHIPSCKHIDWTFKTHVMNNSFSYYNDIGVYEKFLPLSLLISQVSVPNL